MEQRALRYAVRVCGFVAWFWVHVDIDLRFITGCRLHPAHVAHTSGALKHMSVLTLLYGGWFYMAGGLR